VIEAVVDVDDTIINTDRSMHAAWREVLGCEIPLEAVETLRLEQIFMKFASPEQKAHAGELQRRFWDISLAWKNLKLICLDYMNLFPSVQRSFKNGLITAN
jgi:hypothetical protein